MRNSWECEDASLSSTWQWSGGHHARSAPNEVKKVKVNLDIL